MDSVSYRSSVTTNHFKRITKIIYLFTATIFWFEDVELPSVFVKFYNPMMKFLEVILTTFVLTEGGALYTQDLTEKQNTDVIMRSIGTLFPYIAMYGYTMYQKEGIKELLFTLTVTLKEMFNDEKVERLMLKKNHFFLTGAMVVGCCPIIAYGLEGTVHTLTSNATFTTIITIWPDLEDRSPVAGVARVIIFIVWVLLVVHIMSAYSIIATVATCLAHQFTNCYEYFLSLNDIFDGDESIEEQELKYEKAFKDGVKLHCITLNCVNQLQITCQVAYGVQIVINICVIVLLMIEMMQTERTLLEMAPTVLMITGVLISSGLFIWSAADITFEAQRLPTAIFFSGWHNCRGEFSVRMRKTITIAMVEAQRPVVIMALGTIELSYESYVKIVKATYSVFSVIY